MIGEILGDTPGDFRALTLRGLLLLDQGRRDEAQKIFLDLHSRSRRQPVREFEDLLALAHSLMELRGYTNSAQLAKDALDEALRLRRAGFAQDVLIMGPVPPARLDDVVAEDFRLALFDRETARRLAELTADEGRARVHLQLETGTHRQAELVRLVLEG